MFSDSPTYRADLYPHVVEVELLPEKHPTLNYITLHEWNIMEWLIDYVGADNWRNAGSRGGRYTTKGLLIGFNSKARAMEFKLRWTGTNV